MMRIITICGSTRFRNEMAEANRRLTLEGNIVLAPGVFAHDGDSITEEQKIKLDALHYAKINMSTAIYVVNPGGYTGESTQREVEYARLQGMEVMWLEPPSEERKTEGPPDDLPFNGRLSP